MARDILGEFGPDYNSSKQGRGSSGLTSGGGKPNVKSPNYHSPQGPMGLDHKGPGLGGDNHDCGMYGSREHMSGTPGIDGSTKKSGSQR